MSVWVSGMYEARVANRNVAVDLAMNQENGNICYGCGIFRGDFVHVEVVFQACAKEGDFD